MLTSLNPTTFLHARFLFGTASFGRLPAAGLGDGFHLSAAVAEVGGGLGPGLANPLLGMGAMSSLGVQDLQVLLGLLVGLLELNAGQGMGSLLGGVGQGSPLVGAQQGAFGQGGVIDLQQGQTFTTPGGATISWKGNTVTVNEPGGGGWSLGCCGGGHGAGGAAAAAAAGPGGAAAAAAAGPAGAAAAAAAAGFGGGFAAAAAAVGGPCGLCCGSQGQQARPRQWKVWGDPHIKNPDGSRGEFDRKNALFTLQDGTRVLMGADNPKGVVKRVRIILPGAPVDLQGFDPAQTSIMKDVGGRFQSIGSAAQLLQGGFNRPF